MDSRALALGYFQSLTVKWKCSTDFSPMNWCCIFAKKEEKMLEKSCPNSLMAAKIKRQEEKCKQGRKMRTGMEKVVVCRRFWGRMPGKCLWVGGVESRGGEIMSSCDVVGSTKSPPQVKRFAESWQGLPLSSEGCFLSQWWNMNTFSTVIFFSSKKEKIANVSHF